MQKTVFYTDMKRLEGDSGNVEWHLAAHTVWLCRYLEGANIPQRLG